MSELSARDLLDTMADYAAGGENEGQQEKAKPIRLAVIDPAYTGTGDPKVRFEGEASVGLRTYVYTGSTPAAGDRVAMLPVGNSYIVLGELDGGGASASGSPAGSILAWVSNTIPSNYAEANGQALSRTTYSDLFAICGIAFGAGDGSTTFNVPNLKGRVIAATDVSQLDFDTLGKTGGAKTHTLTVSQIPPHSHTPGQSGQGANATPGGTGDNASRSSGGVDPNFRTGSALFSGSGYGSAAVTAGQPHNNLAPYMALKYIIKLSGGIGVLDNTIESVLIDRMGVVETDVAALETRVDRGLPFSMAAGINSVNSVAAGNASNVYWNNSEAISFPAGRFSVTPVIQVTQVDTLTGSVMGAATVESASSTGFNIRLSRLGATPRSQYRVHWTAVQLTSTTAEG
jgi:microcystin-dependent protein